MKDNRKSYARLRLTVGILLGVAGVCALVIGLLGFGLFALGTWLSASLVCIGFLTLALAVWSLLLLAKIEDEVFTTGATDEISRRERAQKALVKAVMYLFLSVLALAMIFPFYWMLISSVKTVEEYNLPTPTLWPHELRWETYLTAFTGGLNLGRLFLNTVIVGVVSTILSLIVTVLSAYAFARMEFKGKNILFALMLATMMIPGELFTITNYITVSAFNWLHTFTVLIVPFLVSVFYIYLLRQNFMQIPNELYLAAKIDGASDLKYLWKVMIPLASPTIISITILKMMGSWNSYMWPQLVAYDSAHMLVTVGLRGADFTDQLSKLFDYPAQMAAVVLVTVPLLIVFIIFRKYIMRGVSRSGIKG